MITVEQQKACVGHAIISYAFWDYLVSLGVDKEWFEDVQLREVWPILGKFYKQYQRLPKNSDEIKSYIQNEIPDFGSDKDYLETLGTLLTVCVKLAKKHKLDILQQSLVLWKKEQEIKDGIHAIIEKFNSKQIDEATVLAKDLAQKLVRVEVLSGRDQDRMISAADRAKIEKEQRIEHSKKLLEYGVSFLDEAYGAIMPSDYIVIGAATGVGKTDLMKNIAKHNSKAGKKVGAFFLEADENEIERRAKYDYMSTRFWQEHPDMPYGTIDYVDFRMKGEHPLLAKYEEEANQYFEENYSGFYTYYRKSQDFTPKTFEREFLRHHKEYDLMILDHLHYVDSDSNGNNENAEMKALNKKIRDLILASGIPVIAISHLRKETDKKNRPLVPLVEDLHGSSDISKIATGVFTLSRCFLDKSRTAENFNQRWLHPTYFATHKARVADVRTHSKCAILYYDSRSNSYLDGYAIGALSEHGKEWNDLENKPYWAKNAINFT